MKKSLFILFAATSVLFCSCESDDELGCYEFTIKTVEVTVSETGTTQKELPVDLFEFCGMTANEAANEAADMNKVTTEETIIDGELAVVTTTTTATYRKLS